MRNRFFGISLLVFGLFHTNVWAQNLEDTERKGVKISQLTSLEALREGRDLYNSNLYQEAIPFLEKASKEWGCEGGAEASALLGLCYLNGKGCDSDHRKAAILFARAESQGSSLGCFFLGFCYLTGRGVERDDEYAELYFQASRFLFLENIKRSLQALF